MKQEFISTKDQLTKALKDPQTKVWETRYQVCLKRYNKTRFETHTNAFAVSKSILQKDLEPAIHNIVKNHVRKMNTNLGIDMHMGSKGNSKPFHIVKAVEITNQNNIQSYLSNGYMGMDIRMEMTKGNIEIYSSDTQCWIQSIVQAFLTHNQYSEEDFINTKQQFVTELEVRKQMQTIIGEREINDGLAIKDVMTWAEKYKKRLGLYIWLADGTKWYDGDDDYDDINQNSNSNKSYSWKSSHCKYKGYETSSNNIVTMHCYINNKHVYLVKPRRLINKYGNYNGTILSQVDTINNLQHEFKDFKYPPKIGLKNFKVITKEEINDEVTKFLIITGAKYKEYKCLVVPTTLKAFVKYMTIELQKLKKRKRCKTEIVEHYNPIDNSFVNPYTRQLIKCLGNSEEIQKYEMQQRIIKKINALYQKRKKQKSLPLNFNYGLQSSASITRNLYHYWTGKEMPYSMYNVFAREVMDKYFTKAIIGTYQDLYDLVKVECNNFTSEEIFDKILNETYHFDCRVSYSTSILNWFEHLEIPVYTCMDNLEHYDGGEIKVGLYLIENYTIKGEYYEIPLYPQLIPHFEVKILMRKYGLRKEHIKYQYLAKYKWKASSMVEYVKWLFAKFDGKEARELVNVWTGTTNFKKTLDKLTFATTDESMFAAMVNRRRSVNMDFEIINDVWYVTDNRTKRRLKDTMAIYQYIIGAGHLNMLEMLDECMTADCTLIGTRVDAVYIYGKPKINSKFIKKENITLENKGDLKHIEKYPYKIEETWNPIDFYDIINIELDVYEKEWIDDFIKALPEEDYDESKDYLNNNTLTQGDGGSGKTRELITLFKKYINLGLKVGVFAFTHAAVQNLRHCVGLGYDLKDEKERKESKKWIKKMTECSQTVDSWLGFDGSDNNDRVVVVDSLTKDEEQIHTKIQRFDVVLIDEFSLLSHMKYYHLLYRVKMVWEPFILKLFGDINQCPAVCSVLYDIRKCQILKTLLGEDGYIINMKYRKGDDQRCDETIMKVIESLKTNGKLPKEVFENYESKHPNKNEYSRWITFKRQTTINNNAKIKDADALEPNDIVICSQTFKTKDNIEIYNNEKLKVIEQTKTEKGIIKLTLERINGRIVKNVTNKKVKMYRSNSNGEQKVIKTYLFTLFNSETVWKYQGETVEEDYIIEEGEMMSREMMITAFGRARKFSQIYLKNWEKLLDKTFYSSYKSRKELIPAHQTKMNVYWMYELEMTKGGKHYKYIGYTNQKLKERKNQHIQNEDEIWDNSTSIRPLGQYLATNEKQAKVMEKALIKEWKESKKSNEWILQNETHNKVDDYECEYEKVKERIKFTLEDYLDKLIPYHDNEYWNRYEYTLRKEFGGGNPKKITYTPVNKKQRKKRDGSGELIPYKREAKEILNNERIDIFRKYYPLLYESIVKDNS